MQASNRTDLACMGKKLSKPLPPASPELVASAFKAAESGDFERIKELLASEPRLALAKKNMETLLHCCCRQRPVSAAVLQLLLESECDIASPDFHCSTPVHHLILSKDAELTEKTVDFAVRKHPQAFRNAARATDGNGDSCLSLACQHSTFKVVDALIDFTPPGIMASVSYNENGCLPAHHLLDRLLGDKDPFGVQLAAKLIKKSWSVFKTRSKRKNSVLHLCAAIGDPGLMAAAVSAAKRTRSLWSTHITNAAGKTPLHLAAKSGDAEIVRALMEHCELRCWDWKGRSPVHVAANAEILNLFFLEKPSEVADIVLVGVQNVVGGQRSCDAQMLLQLGKFGLLDRVFDFVESHVSRWEGIYSKDALSTLVDAGKSVIASPGEAVAGPGMFSIQFCSDLHAEFSVDRDEGVQAHRTGSRRADVEEFVVKCLKPSAPYLALLGDIALAAMPTHFQKLLEEVSKRFKRVFLIAGNHEHYHVSIPESLTMLRKLCNALPNVMFMENDSCIVDGVKLCGATLWSDVPEHCAKSVSQALNDYHTIQFDERKLQVADTTKWHRNSVAWLNREIEQAHADETPVIVLSHHAPMSSRGVCQPDYWGEATNTAFCSNLDGSGEAPDLLRPPVVAWLYGHTHWGNSLMINGARVLSNPKGYGFETREFRVDRLLSVPLP